MNAKLLFLILAMLSLSMFIDKKSSCFEWNREINVFFQDNLFDTKGNEFAFKSKINYYGACDIPKGLEEIRFYERNPGFRPF